MRYRSVVAAVVLFGASFALACGDDDGDGGFPSGPQGARAECSPDDLAPAISSVSASPNVLWPPNHQMVTVNLSVAASDECSDVDSRIIDVTSNEPTNGLGDGDTSPDWVIIGPLTVQLRSERAGVGDGRVYTITVRVEDDDDNAAFRTVTVVVPHDQGQ